MKGLNKPMYIRTSIKRGKALVLLKKKKKKKKKKTIQQPSKCCSPRIVEHLIVLSPRELRQRFPI